MIDRPRNNLIRNGNRIADSARFYTAFVEGAGKSISDATRQISCSFTSGMAWADSRMGRVPSFGGSDYINCGNNGRLTFSGKLSLWAWINTSNATASYQQIASKSAGDSFPPFEFRFDSTTGKLQVLLTGGGTLAFVSSTSTLSNNTWYLVGLVYTGAALEVWINGIREATTSASGAISTTTEPFAIGTRRINGGAQYPFNGKIACVGLHDIAFGANEFRTVMDDPYYPIRQRRLAIKAGSTAPYFWQMLQAA